MIKKVLTAILVGSISLGLLNAQVQQNETLSLSVEEAQKYAIAHNLLMTNASLHVKKSEVRKWYARYFHKCLRVWIIPII